MDIKTVKSIYNKLRYAIESNHYVTLYFDEEILVGKLIKISSRGYKVIGNYEIVSFTTANIKSVTEDKNSYYIIILEERRR